VYGSFRSISSFFPPVNGSDAPISHGGLCSCALPSHKRSPSFPFPLLASSLSPFLSPSADRSASGWAEGSSASSGWGRVAPALRSLIDSYCGGKETAPYKQSSPILPPPPPPCCCSLPFSELRIWCSEGNQTCVTLVLLRVAGVVADAYVDGLLGQLAGVPPLSPLQVPPFVLRITPNPSNPAILFHTFTSVSPI
jgi:hypothetical protein